MEDSGSRISLPNSSTMVVEGKMVAKLCGYAWRQELPVQNHNVNKDLSLKSEYSIF